MKSEYNIALIGDLKGCVEATLEQLTKREFPIGKIFPLETQEQDVDSETQTVMFSGKPVDVIDIEGFDWQNVDIAFFLGDIEISKTWADIASEHCVVIDNSGAFLRTSVASFSESFKSFSAL